jgi:hypothetical protein
MTRVGIYEVSTHENKLTYFCRIGHRAGFDLTVYTTPELAETVEPQVPLDPDAFVEKQSSESVGQFLDRVERDAETLDLLMIDSVYGGLGDLFAYSRFDPDCPFLLWIYNLNAWFGRVPAITNGIRPNVTKLLRQRILSNADGINFEYEPLERYARTRFGVSHPSFTVAPTLYEGRSADPPSGWLSVTVPGQIERRRRDYDTVLDVFTELFERHGDGVSLTLLGGPQGSYGDRIVDRCRSLSNRGYTVEWFSEFVPISKYHETIQESDLLLCPLQPSIDRGGWTETYGETKGTGSVFDGIRNATPMVFPDHFCVSDELEDATVGYGDDGELEAAMNRLIAEPDRLEALRAAAATVAEGYDLDSQAETFSAVVSSLRDAR